MTLRGVDSNNPAALLSLPFRPDFAFGYPDGRWPDAQAIADELGIPVFRLNVFDDGVPGDGSDSEPGDTTIAEAVDLTVKELAAGVWRPVKYCPASWAAKMVQAHDAAGIVRSKYRLVSAHYGRGAHICGPATCGYEQADATQWIDHGDWDETLALDTFLQTLPTPPAPPVPIPQEDDMIKIVIVSDGTTEWGVTFLNDAPAWKWALSPTAAPLWYSLLGQKDVPEDPTFCGLVPTKG